MNGLRTPHGRASAPPSRRSGRALVFAPRLAPLSRVFVGKLGSFACSLMLACGAGESPVRAPSRADIGESGQSRPDLAWAMATFSPQPAPPPEFSLPGCDGYDTALTRVAERVARAQAGGQAQPDISEVVEHLRAAGSPQVWPRVWTIESAALSRASVAPSFESSLGGPPAGVARRCGVAHVEAPGAAAVVAVVSVDVLADLDPLPTRARLGQWLGLSARVLVPSGGGRIVLLGERGPPRVVPSELSRGELRSTFSLDQSGLFRIQALLDTEAGPRPVLESWVFVDQEPEYGAGSKPAPGEELASASGEVSAEALLLGMINAARRSEGLAEVVRNADLDRVAQEHAEALRRARRTAHDVGSGMPAERARRAGISARRVGENVARARSLPRAHRALWHSPAHRSVLLDASFHAVGLGVAFESSAPSKPGAQGPTRTSEVRAEVWPEVWIVELFAEHSQRSPPARGRQ